MHCAWYVRKRTGENISSVIFPVTSERVKEFPLHLTAILYISPNVFRTSSWKFTVTAQKESKVEQTFEIENTYNW